ncbi:hypothetical protein D9M68_759150 [compost metagenome]
MAFWISPRIPRTCAVACFDCSARALTSCATTEKPLPVSPALTASIEALTPSRLDCSARSPTEATISPIAWLCSPRRMMLSATACICSRICCMPASASSTAWRPPWATWRVRSVLSATACDLLPASTAVCLTSSTVVAISLIAVAVSWVLEATWLVAARISSLEPASTVMPSFISCTSSRRLRTMVAKARPSTSRSETAWISSCN